jgi:uncharacterized protein YaaQ
METKAGNILLIAVIQSQDVENADGALQQLGLFPVRLPSVGGFLGRRNATLMIPTPLEQVQTVLDSLQATCRQRIEYIAVPLESAPLPLPTPTPITIGGATIFGLEIEHYEEI